MTAGDRLPGTLCRAVWWSITAPVSVCGVAGAFLLLGAGRAVLLAGLAAGVAASLGWLLHQPPARVVTATTLVGLALLCGLGLLALIGLIGELGGAGLAVAALLAAARALTFHRPPRRQPRPGPAPPPGGHLQVPAIEHIPTDPLPALSAVRSLSTRQLCWAWRVSYLRVLRPDCPSSLDHLAEFRRTCMDELEQRNPVAFARWLPTARAAGDPARFFICRQPQE